MIASSSTYIHESSLFGIPLAVVSAGDAGGRNHKGSSHRMGSLRKPIILKKSVRRGKSPAQADRESMRVRRWVDADEDEDFDFDEEGPSVKDRLESLAKSGKSIANDVLRRAKVLRSSPFEALILKATWPDDMPVRYDLLEELVQHSIPAFKYARWSPDEDPYHMTLHKLWTKMAERDWRTVTKSLFILHCISRDSKADVCKKFANAIKTMSRARNVKNHKHYYFDPRVVGELNDAGRQFKAFVVSYAKYVLHRAKMFSGRFDELRGLKPSVEEGRAVAVLRDAKDAIDRGLACNIKDPSLENVIVCHALRLVATDVDELWREFGSKICPLVSATETYNRRDNTTKAGEGDIKGLLEYFETSGEKVKSFLSETQKLCRRNRVKFSIDSSGSVVSMPSRDDIRNRIAELSGGYIGDVLGDDASLGQESSGSVGMLNAQSNSLGPRRHPAETDGSDEEEEEEDGDENEESDDEEEEDSDDDGDDRDDAPVDSEDEDEDELDGEDEEEDSPEYSADGSRGNSDEDEDEDGDTEADAGDEDEEADAGDEDEKDEDEDEDVSAGAADHEEAEDDDDDDDDEGRDDDEEDGDSGPGEDGSEEDDDGGDDGEEDEDEEAFDDDDFTDV